MRLTIRYVPYTDTFTCKQRCWYAVSWPYGRGVTTGDSPNVHAACNPIAFATKAERDEWVDNTPTPYTSQQGYREAVTTRDLPYGWTREKFRNSALEAAELRNPVEENKT